MFVSYSYGWKLHSQLSIIYDYGNGIDRRYSLITSLRGSPGTDGTEFLLPTEKTITGRQTTRRPPLFSRAVLEVERA